jgi:hypothetical protein
MFIQCLSTFVGVLISCFLRSMTLLSGTYVVYIDEQKSTQFSMKNCSFRAISFLDVTTMTSNKGVRTKEYDSDRSQIDRESNATLKVPSSVTRSSSSHHRRTKHHSQEQYRTHETTRTPFAQTREQRGTPYEKLIHRSQNDVKFQDDIAAGRRIGFYAIRGNIGLGNFSRVKLGVHLLVNGTFHCYDVFHIRFA